MKSSIATTFALAFGIWLIPDHLCALEPKRPNQESFLSRAIFADGRVWMLSDSGELFTVRQGEKARAQEALPDPALDLCVLEGRPAAITCNRQSCTTWTIRRRSDHGWSVQGTVQAEPGEHLVAMKCADGATILTTRRLIDLRGQHKRAVTLSEGIRPGLVAVVHETADHVFVGINNGEWGGGLSRIDRRTGKVSTIEASILRPTLNPVTAISSDPWHPHCVVVAVGLIHLLPYGQIVEVCGNEARRLYYKPLREEQTLPSPSSDAPVLDTVAFFGLAPDGSGLWAVGMDGMYRIEAGGKAFSKPLPKFEEVDGFAVSFEIPDLVLVLTDIASRRSVGGSIPMVVLKESVAAQ